MRIGTVERTSAVHSVGEWLELDGSSSRAGLEIPTL